MIKRVAFVVLAIPVGIAVDFVGSTVGALFSVVGLGILDGIAGSSLSKALTAPNSALQLGFSLFFGGIATTLGAFVAARIAAVHTLVFGMLFALSSLLFSACLESVSPMGSRSSGRQVIHIVLVVVASLLGAFLESLYSRRRTIAT